MLPCRSQRPSKPTQSYDPIPQQPRKRASTTTSIAPSISKKSCSNNLPSFTQTHVAAEALQQLFHSAQKEVEAVEDQLETWTENEEEEEVIDERLSLSLPWMLSPLVELATFSYTWQAVSGKGKTKEILDSKAGVFCDIKDADFNKTHFDIEFISYYTLVEWATKLVGEQLVAQHQFETMKLTAVVSLSGKV